MKNDLHGVRSANIKKAVEMRKAFKTNAGKTNDKGKKMKVRFLEEN